MKKIKLKKNQKITLIIITTIILIFATINIAWLYEHFFIYKPLIENHQLYKNEGNDAAPDVLYSSDAICASNGKYYTFFISVPKYLHFSGQYELSRARHIDSDDSTEDYIHIVCCKKMFFKNDIYIRVFKNTDSGIHTIYDIIVDKNLNLIDDNEYSDEEKKIYSESFEEVKCLYDLFQDYLQN